MQDAVEAAHWHVLTYHHQVRRRVAAAYHRQHVGMGEDPQLGILLIKVPGYPRGAFSQSQDFSGDLIPLPFSPPGLTTWPRIQQNVINYHQS